MSPTHEELVAHVRAEIRILDRQLARWDKRGDTSTPMYRRTVNLLEEKRTYLNSLRAQARAKKSQTRACGPRPEIPRGLKHNPSYRSVSVSGNTYALTDRQAQMIQILHEAHKDGVPDVSIAYILEQLGTAASRWQDTFRSNPQARKALITEGDRKGTLRLKT